MKFNLTALVVLLFFAFDAHSQTPKQGGHSNQIFLPIDLSAARGAEALTNVDFLMYPYQGPRVDLRNFKEKFADLNYIQDWIEITPPSLSQFNEANVLVGRIEGTNPDLDGIAIWIVGDFNSSSPVFFFDQNLNRDFNDDGPSTLVKPGKAHKVSILPASGAYGEKKVEITLPQRKDPIAERNKKQKKKISKGERTRLNNQFAIGIQASVGSGKNEFSLQNEDLGFPTWYSVDFTQKGIGLNVSYSLPYIRLGVNGMFQNHFFYTSYLNEQYGEPRVVVNPFNGRRTTMEQVRIERNQDIHSRNHYQYSAELALRLKMSSRVDIQPFVTYGRYVYADGVYIGDNDETATTTYDMPDSETMEFGLRFEFAVGDGRALHIDAMMQDIDWNPQAYFNTFNYSGLTRSKRIYKILVGYRFGL